MKIAYLTGGTVGAGHLVRGVAIGRGLERAGLRGTYRMFGPRLPFAAARMQEGYEVIDIAGERAALTHPHLAVTTELARRLEAFDADLLIVDLFWAAVRWLLPHLRCEAWLLLRICPPVWLVGSPELPFAPAQFARVIGIEPVDYPAVGDRLDPVVVCNPGECRPRAALRERLGVPAGRELAVVVHAGEPGEADQLRAAAAPAQPITLDLFEPEALFPAAEWLPGADRVHAGAGYNAFWEARWLGYAERTRFLPFRRSIDDQDLRLRTFRESAMRANGADTLARWILG
jgi:hypothetical protein